MGAIALGIVGGILGLAGGGLSASGASKKRRDLLDTTSDWLPDIPLFQDQYFADLDKFQPRATKLAREISEADLDTALALREKATPGIAEGLAEGGKNVFDMMAGIIPKPVLDAYSRAGGAGAVGRGIRGDLNFLQQGLSAGRGAIDRMSLGFSWLPALLGAAPDINITSPMEFLQNIMTPGQRTSTQMGVRGQNLGVASQVAGMPTSAEAFGESMSSIGGLMAGGAMMGMGGGSMGGGSTGGGVMSYAKSPYGYFGSDYFSPTMPKGGYSKMTGAGRLNN